jgi:NitT/TauT family transport system substrate-binding protein
MDIGLQGPEPTIYLYNQDSENYLVNFAQLTKKDGSFIMSRTPIENFTIGDLVGKSILGGRAGGVPEMTLEYVIKQAGYSLKQNSFDADVNVRTDVQFAAMAGSFIAGEGDFTTLFEPSCTELELGGYGYVVASVGELSGEIPYTAYSTTIDFYENHSDILEKFVKAIYKGQLFVKDHTNLEVAKVLQKTFTDIPLENLEIIVERYRSIDAWCLNPYFEKEGFEKLMDVMELAGELEKRAKYGDLVKNEIVNSVLKS